MTDEHDELTGIFDNLKPEDFSVGDGPNLGHAAFDKFVGDNLRTVRTGFLASDGHLNPIAVLSDSQTQVVLVPEGAETLGDWLERLRSEAQKLGATWFFLCRKTMVGHYQSSGSEPVPDATDPNAVAEAMSKGLMSEGLFFYAERMENGDRESRHGLMEIQDGRLGEVREGDPATQSVEFWQTVLG